MVFPSANLSISPLDLPDRAGQILFDRIISIEVVLVVVGLAVGSNECNLFKVGIAATDVLLSPLFSRGLHILLQVTVHNFSSSTSFSFSVLIEISSSARLLLNANCICSSNTWSTCDRMPSWISGTSVQFFLVLLLLLLLPSLKFDGVPSNNSLAMLLKGFLAITFDASFSTCRFCLLVLKLFFLGKVVLPFPLSLFSCPFI
mmetsp:Transcript_25834/g.39596  ORF Transcript_25834/g.39596 Transcript_25834/m.39596 type:complete len:202 (-) Transcript_25834:1157-1762(-)